MYVQLTVSHKRVEFGSPVHAAEQIPIPLHINYYNHFYGPINAKRLRETVLIKDILKFIKQK